MSNAYEQLQKVNQKWGALPPSAGSLMGVSFDIYMRAPTPTLPGMTVQQMEVMQRFQPQWGVSDPTALTIFENRDKFNRDIRTPMRPRKALKKMFPYLTEKEVDALGDAITPVPVVPDTLHDDTRFVHAYRQRIGPTSNISLCDGRKSIANSCMRYSFDHLRCHPAAAYDSGEFRIVWTDDANKHITGRCVVHIPSMSAGPIYGASDHAIDQIATYLAQNSFARTTNWEGAKLVAISYGEGFIAPYIDGDYQEFDHDGETDHLILTSDGEYQCSQTGLTENCNDDDDDDDYDYEYSSYCEHSQNYYRSDDMEDVVTALGLVNTVQRWGPSARVSHATYMGHSDQWYADDILPEDHMGNWIDPAAIADGTFVIHTDGKYYPEGYEHEQAA